MCAEQAGGREAGQCDEEWGVQQWQPLQVVWQGHVTAELLWFGQEPHAGLYTSAAHASSGFLSDKEKKDFNGFKCSIKIITKVEKVKPSQM